MPDWQKLGIAFFFSLFVCVIMVIFSWYVSAEEATFLFVWNIFFVWKKQ